jgi:lipid A 3-O-deacylase
MRSRGILLSIILALATPLHASAADPPVEPEPMVSFSAGKLGVFNQIGDSFEAGAAYRFRPFGRWALAPALGFLVHDDGTYFIYAELRRDFWLTERWVLVPSFGGGFFEKGELSLGHNIEFRSGLELGYRFDNEWRVGLALFHLSNGGIGDRNPGTEALVLSATAPMRSRSATGRTTAPLGN